MLQPDTMLMPGATAALAGDARPLLEQLGAEVEIASQDAAGHVAPLRQVRSLADLQIFLAQYETQVLAPLEWPAILRAHQHAARNELRELLELDRQLAAEPALREFAGASCRVGQRQLNRLRGLRDQRLLQRYRQAIEAGQARGWHTLVYGIALQVFSLPLRQGLLHYAQQTTQGFLAAAARPLRLTEPQCDALLAGREANWPVAVNALLEKEMLAALKPA